MVGAPYLLWEIEPMHLSVEGLRPWDWWYPVLQYLREWPTPTVVSSLSRVLSINTNQRDADHLWYDVASLNPTTTTGSLERNGWLAIMVSVWDWSARYCTYRRERPSLLNLLAVWIRINFWLDGWGSISPLGDWANALECWRSPSLKLVIPGIAVSPGVTHSDSRIVFVTGTVVKHQPHTHTRDAYINYDFLLIWHLRA